MLAYKNVSCLGSSPSGAEMKAQLNQAFQKKRQCNCLTACLLFPFPLYFPPFLGEKKNMAKPIKTKDGFRLHFHLHNIQYKLGMVKNEHSAKVLQAQINVIVEQIKCGLVNIPRFMSPKDFIAQNILNDRKKQNKDNLFFRLSDLISEYSKYSVPPIKSMSTCQTEKYHLARLQDFIFFSNSDPEISSASIGYFNDYKKFRYSKNVKTDTVKKELATFQSMFKFAVEHNYIQHNIIKEVKRDKSQIPAGRFRTISEIQKLIEEDKHTSKEIKDLRRFTYLNKSEIAELFEHAKHHWILPILKLFVYTGMRRGELVKLTWLDVDFDRNIIQVSSQKQSQKQDVKRNIEMHPEVAKLLRSQRLKTGHNRFVFLNALGTQIKEDTMNEVLNRLTKNTKFHGIGFHVFRHSLASNLASAGVDQRIIDSILGHQTEEMRKRYQHLFPGKQTQALQLVTV